MDCRVLPTCPRAHDETRRPGCWQPICGEWQILSMLHPRQTCSLHRKCGTHCNACETNCRKSLRNWPGSYPRDFRTRSAMWMFPEKSPPYRCRIPVIFQDNLPPVAPRHFIPAMVHPVLLQVPPAAAVQPVAILLHPVPDPASRIPAPISAGRIPRSSPQAAMTPHHHNPQPRRSPNPLRCNPLHPRGRIRAMQRNHLLSLQQPGQNRLVPVPAILPIPHHRQHHRHHHPSHGSTQEIHSGYSIWRCWLVSGSLPG